MVEDDRIVVDPRVMVGKPVIKGTRIPVYVVLEFLSLGHSVKDVLKAYPDLKEADVRAAIRYASRILEREVVREEESVA